MSKKNENDKVANDNALIKRVVVITEGMTEQNKCVVYLMSRDQRVGFNHALLAAQLEALERNLPLIVLFQLKKRVGVRSLEHYQFMLEGLEQLETKLASLNISFLVISPAQQLVEVVASLKPSTLYLDFSPLRGAVALRQHLAENLGCTIKLVDTHNLVPCWIVSNKQEYNAYFFRKKHHKFQAEYLVRPVEVAYHPFEFSKNELKKMKLSLLNWLTLLDQVEASSSPGACGGRLPGEEAAQKTLSSFIKHKLLNYAKDRNDPSKDALSNLSAYLHFGQISALQVALQVLDYLETDALILPEKMQLQLQESAQSFLEELLVRKELADNFCHYNQNYDSLLGAPDWARTTLAEHQLDPREHLYSPDELKQARTHDSAWNAAQKQLLQTGKIHGYMRMYWAKKILEWSPSPQEAVETAIYLNDRYSLDGHDPNGYVGILWSIAGLHDRPWQERPIFGKVRYMSHAGLKRKFNLADYIKQNNN